jgi:membrane protein implicated in regulation of membrane protease activity
VSGFTFLATSLLLLVVAGVALAVGWLQASESLTYLSVGASVVAGLCLPFAYAFSRAEAKRPVRAEDADDL